jgi:hypothetical protein
VADADIALAAASATGPLNETSWVFTIKSGWMELDDDACVVAVIMGGVDFGSKLLLLSSALARAPAVAPAEADDGRGRDLVTPAGGGGACARTDEDDKGLFRRP